MKKDLITRRDVSPDQQMDKRCEFRQFLLPKFSDAMRLENDALDKIQVTSRVYSLQIYTSWTYTPRTVTMQIMQGLKDPKSSRIFGGTKRTMVQSYLESRGLHGVQVLQSFPSFSTIILTKPRVSNYDGELIIVEKERREREKERNNKKIKNPYMAIRGGDFRILLYFFKQNFPAITRVNATVVSISIVNL